MINSLTFCTSCRLQVRGANSLRVARLARGGCLLLLLISAAFAHPVNLSSPQPPTTSPEGGSHVVFFINMRQLIDRLSGLAEMARDVLVSKCHDDHDSSQATKLPCSLEQTSLLEDIEGLGPVPSHKVLEKEYSRTFLKHLLKDAYRTLLRLETLSTNEVSDGDSSFSVFAQKLGETNEQLKDTISSYLHARFADHVRGMKKMKKTYLRKKHTREEYRRRLLYTTWDLLNRVKAVLQYAVDLSWRTHGDSVPPA